MPLDLDKTTEMKCSKCDGEYFVVKYLLRHISAIVAPSGQDTIIPIQVFSCANCGHVDQEFLP
jgi:hypothetical protein